MNTIILKSKNNNLLTITLHDILSQINNIEEYVWKLVLLEGVSNKMDILVLEHLINKSPSGIFIRTNDLLKISTLFDQITEIILIGDNNIGKMQRLEYNDSMQNQYEYYIELIDSSYWEVTSKNRNFLNNIKLKLG